MKKIFLLLIIFLSVKEPGVSAQDKPYDYLIQNALVYDGESLRGTVQDVAVSGNLITGVGQVNPSDAKHVIDASGLVLAPGFIDAHTHSDFNPIVYSRLPNKILQGVTTEVTGNCGMSAAPVIGEHQQHVQDVWAREGVAIDRKLPWKTFREYRNAIEEAGLLTNMANLVGHGNLRYAVIGTASRTARPEEIESMKSHLAKAMTEGAYGISFGLVYLPGIFAAEEELVALCTEAAKYDGVCAFHMRSEGSRLIEALQEAIRIGKQSNARIQISHLKAAGGPSNWGKITQAFQLIEEARQEGVKIEADVYPYTAGFAELGVTLPDDIYERKDRIKFLKDPAQHDALIARLKEHYQTKGTDWGNIVIATTPHSAFKNFMGKSMKQISDESGKSPEEMLVEILAGTDFQVSAYYFSQSQEVVDEVLSKPYVSIGSDSIADGSGGTHPRTFGTFPKILNQSARNQQKMQMGEVIRKMTSLPARHFRLKNRGIIRPGYFADLVLFDPEQVQGLADYKSPERLSQGVQWVFINGQAVVQDGKYGGELKGQFLLLQG